MRKKRMIILWLLISLYFPTFIFAETILLKSGKTVEGKLLEKTDKYIKIDFDGVPLTYFFDEIESIDGQPLLSNDREDRIPDTNSNSSSAEAYFKNGYELLYKGNYNQAIDYLKKAIAADANYAKAYAYIGLAYQYLHDYHQAQENFRKAKELSGTIYSGSDISFVDKYLSSQNQEQPAKLDNNSIEKVKNLYNIVILVTQFILILLAFLIALFGVKVMKSALPLSILFSASLFFLISISYFIFAILVKSMSSLFLVIGSFIYFIVGFGILALQKWAKTVILWLGILATVQGLITKQIFFNLGVILSIIEFFVIYLFLLKDEYF